MPAEPMDSGDLDALLEMERSLGYRLLTSRIQEAIADKLADLERPSSEETTALLRGGIAALRMVLTIPDSLKAEIGAEPRYVKGKH